MHQVWVHHSSLEKYYEVLDHLASLISLCIVITWTCISNKMSWVWKVKGGAWIRLEGMEFFGATMVLIGGCIDNFTMQRLWDITRNCRNLTYNINLFHMLNIHVHILSCFRPFMWFFLFLWDLPMISWGSINPLSFVLR